MSVSTRILTSILKGVFGSNKKYVGLTATKKESQDMIILN